MMNAIKSAAVGIAVVVVALTCQVILDGSGYENAGTVAYVLGIFLGTVATGITLGILEEKR